MNLLNSVFNRDDYEINKRNHFSIILVSIMIVIIVIILVMSKECYYSNVFNKVQEDIVLLVDKDYVNKIKDEKEILIDDIKYEYSIKKLEQLNDNYMISININTKLENINQGIYKIIIGKESIFDYIIRIIKK